MLRSLAMLSVLTSLPATVVAESEANVSCALTAPIRDLPTDPPARAGLAGWWYANVDRTIWAGWDALRMRAGSEGNKVLWFRSRGAELVVTGRRLDADSAPAEIDIPCCYGGSLQSSGVFFPSAGCWEITAKAGDSELAFVTLVYPGRAAN